MSICISELFFNSNNWGGGAVESNWVHSVCRSPFGLLYLPGYNYEDLVEWWLVGETEVLGENLPQCRFVHHKSPHMTWPGVNPGPRCGKPATNRLSYGTANFRTYSYINEDFLSLFKRKMLHKWKLYILKDIRIKFAFEFDSNVTGMRTCAARVFVTSFGILDLRKEVPHWGVFHCARRALLRCEIPWISW
jgi:hypothetical protein